MYIVKLPNFSQYIKAAYICHDRQDFAKKNNTKTVTSPKDLQYGTVMEGPLIPEIYVNLCTPVKFREHQMSRFYLNK